MPGENAACEAKCTESQVGTDPISDIASPTRPSIAACRDRPRDPERASVSITFDRVRQTRRRHIVLGAPCPSKDTIMAHHQWIQRQCHSVCGDVPASLRVFPSHHGSSHRLRLRIQSQCHAHALPPPRVLYRSSSVSGYRGVKHFLHPLQETGYFRRWCRFS